MPKNKDGRSTRETDTLGANSTANTMTEMVVTFLFGRHQEARATTPRIYGAT